jgi:hypothetical protein
MTAVNDDMMSAPELRSFSRLATIPRLECTPFEAFGEKRKAFTKSCTSRMVVTHYLRCFVVDGGDPAHD